MQLSFSINNDIFYYAFYIKYPVVLEYTAKATSRLTKMVSVVWLYLLVEYVS